MKKQWPTVVAPQKVMTCEKHGEVKVGRVPDHFSREAITTLEGRDRWGCSACVGEVSKALAEAERAAREQKERALAEKRAAKRKLIDDAHDAEETLRAAVADFDKVRDLPSLAELERRLEDAKRRLAAAHDKLAAAQEKVATHEAKVAEVEEAISRNDEDRDAVRASLVTAFETAEEAWTKVSRIKREKHRDKSLRALARKYVG